MRLAFACIGCVSLLGCSAILKPDETRLRAIDSGTPSETGMTDLGGPETASDVVDVPDVFVPDTVDTGPVCEVPCDDGVACTIEACEGRMCTSMPDTSRCSSGQICDARRGCIAMHCRNDSDCSDNNVCTGRERCDPRGAGTGCLPGTPMTCGDSIPCTADRCDPLLGCVSTPNAAACDDRVACTEDRCVGGILSDTNGCVHVTRDELCPGTFCGGRRCVATGTRAGCQIGEAPNCSDALACTEDSCEESVDRCVHRGIDEDGDGYAAANLPSGTFCGGPDCDDDSEAVHPGAVDTCGNGIDEDCSGRDAVCPRRGDTCDMPIIVALEPDDSRSFNGRFEDFNHNYTSPCGGDGPDIVYQFDLPPDQDIVIDTLGSSADTVLSVGPTCDLSPSTSVCDDDIREGVNTASRIFIRAGTLSPLRRAYAFLDVLDTARGNFTITFTANPRSGSTCGGPLVRSAGLDISLGGAVVGVQNAIFSSTAGTCGGGLTTEEILRFNTSAPGASRGSARVSALSAIGSALYVRRGEGCGVVGVVEEGCVPFTTAPTATLTLRDVADGTHWVVMDGTGYYALDYNPPR